MEKYQPKIQQLRSLVQRAGVINACDLARLDTFPSATLDSLLREDGTLVRVSRRVYELALWLKCQRPSSTESSAYSPRFASMKSVSASIELIVNLADRQNQGNS